MVGPNSETRAPEARLDLLEYRAGAAETAILGLRTDMNKGLGDLSSKLSRQIFATWMLVAALVSAAASIVVALKG